MSDDAKKAEAFRSLFARYPWRGGFSTTNFIGDLHALIPANDDVVISQIKYASPGFVETRINAGIAKTVREIVDQINDRSTGPAIREAYGRIQNNLKKSKWSGQASMDVVLKPDDLSALESYLWELCSTIGLKGREGYIVSLGKDDLLAAVKIVLAYYRRMFWIADYVRTGKVQRLFSYEPNKDDLI